MERYENPVAVIRKALEEIKEEQSKSTELYLPTPVPGLYVARWEYHILAHMTVVQKQGADTYVTWDTNWPPPGPPEYPQRDMAAVSGLRIHGILVVEAELEASLTILIQPKKGLVRRLEIHPLEEDDKKILKYVRDNGHKRPIWGPNLGRLRIPDALLKPKDGDDHSKLQLVHCS